MQEISKQEENAKCFAAYIITCSEAQDNPYLLWESVELQSVPIHASNA
jgi:hypothetical protein